jgi:hypothetical protein
VPIAEARIDTDRPSRYLVQFCKHAAAMGSGRGHQLRAHAEGVSATGRPTIRAEWSDTSGTVTFDPWGTCHLRAGDTELLVRVQATSDDNLERIEEIVTADLGRFSRQELSIGWHSIGAELAEKQRITARHPTVRRLWRTPWLLAVVGVLIVAAHLAAGGFVLTRWGWPVAVVIAIAAVGMLAVGGYHVTRGQRWRHGARREPRD